MYTCKLTIGASISNDITTDKPEYLIDIVVRDANITGKDIVLEYIVFSPKKNFGHVILRYVIAPWNWMLKDPFCFLPFALV